MLAIKITIEIIVINVRYLELYARTESSDALVNLGFMKNDIERFLSSINIDEMEIEDIIKLSMKQL